MTRIFRHDHGSVALTTPLNRLTTALADRYAIEAALGAGGMATVYLAHDVKHERKVAIKVLHPELAASLGAERFEREITIAAGLSHPNILPLLDSGSLDELLYYVMPLVEGESLRDRIHREKQLSLDDAVQITQQIASALAYAHSRGVVHRDIKPDNVMLSSGQAVVTDFGIARAVGEAGGETLTQTGMAIGTPAYMSPEQSAGESNVDARTDIYALGCVLYEMLAGEQPYTGTTPGAIIAKRLSTPVPDVRILRETVPDHIEAALRRSLAKAPADRFVTATELAEALRGDRVAARVSTSETQPVRITPRTTPGTRRAVLASVGVIAVMGLGWWATRGDRIGGDLDPDIIAVMPFRVGGDPAFGYLRESMLDLLSARLTGEGGPRVLESRTTLSAWRRAVGDESEDLSENDSRRVAAQLGAGRLMLGNIVATPSELTLSGTLLDVADGSLVASGSAAGSPDSLATLVNRLTAQLLSLEAGEGRERLSGLATTSLEALQQYLAGQRAYRTGNYIEAMDLYGRAFASDSDFVQAGFGMVAINHFLGDAITMAGRFAEPRVWRLRDRLSDQDLAFLLAVPWVGPDFPLPSTQARLIEQAEAGARAYSDSPEHWLLLGQLLALAGAYAAVPDWADRAARALDRAISLDSSFAVALQTRLVVAMLANDSDGTRRAASALEQMGEASGHRWTLWAAAMTLGDSVRVRGMRDRFDELSPLDLHLLPLFAIRLGLPLDDAHGAVETLRARAATEDEAMQSRPDEIALAAVEGRVQDAIAGIQGMTYWSQLFKDWYVLSMALFEAPYREAATVVAARVAAAYPEVGAVPEIGVQSYSWPVLNDCHGTLFRIVQGDTSNGRATLRRHRAWVESPPPPAEGMAALFINDVLEPARLFGVCAALLDVLVEEGTPGVGSASTRIDVLDSLARQGPRGVDNMAVPAPFANLVIARAREAQGDIGRALATVRRRTKDGSPGFLWTLPVFLREEGRLAALAGDTTGSIRAYEHYLTLRTDPDPPLVPQRDSVAAELSTLTGR